MLALKRPTVQSSLVLIVIQGLDVFTASPRVSIKFESSVEFENQQTGTPDSRVNQLVESSTYSRPYVHIFRWLHSGLLMVTGF